MLRNISLISIVLYLDNEQALLFLIIIIIQFLSNFLTAYNISTIPQNVTYVALNTPSSGIETM